MKLRDKKATNRILIEVCKNQSSRMKKILFTIVAVGLFSCGPSPQTGTNTLANRLESKVDDTGLPKSLDSESGHDLHHRNNSYVDHFDSSVEFTMYSNQGDVR